MHPSARQLKLLIGALRFHLSDSQGRNVEQIRQELLQSAPEQSKYPSGLWRSAEESLPSPFDKLVEGEFVTSQLVHDRY